MGYIYIIYIYWVEGKNYILNKFENLKDDFIKINVK